jgi:hypothetical protein
MEFDLSRLRRGEVLAGASAVLLLMLMLLVKWYGNGGGARSGWESLVVLRWLLAATIAATFGLVIAQATRRATVLGSISVLALIYRVLINPPTHEQAGAFLGLISAAGIAYGGYLSLRKEGIARRDAPREIPTVRPGRGNGT